MSAGDRTDHFVQDAAEAYLAWRLQGEAERLDQALAKTSPQLRADFDHYVSERDLGVNFAKSEYARNVDAIVVPLVRELAQRFPTQRFLFENVEKEFRDLKRKGDIRITFSSGEKLSISVKNYKNGFQRIQLCSGTWNSFLNNFLFKSDGVGMFIDPFNGERFSGSNRERRDSVTLALGFGSLLPVYEFIDEINDVIRSIYADDDRAIMWADIAEQWKDDCRRYGAEASRIIGSALGDVDSGLLKARLLEMAGLNFEEELLLLGKGKYLFSLTNSKYRALLENASRSSTTVSLESRGQTLRFVLRHHGSELLAIDVPFTLQKNGAWHLPKIPFAGTEWHPKEKAFLRYGERRPKKSRELATSTNTYLDLKRAGIV